MLEGHRGCVSTGAWVRKCGVRVLSCSVLYLFEEVRRWPGTQTLIPLSVGFAMASWGPVLSFLLRHTHLDALTAILGTLQHQQKYTLTVITQETMKTFQLPDRMRENCEACKQPLKLNIKIYTLPHQSATSSKAVFRFSKDADYGGGF